MAKHSGTYSGYGCRYSTWDNPPPTGVFKSYDKAWRTRQQASPSRGRHPTLFRPPLCNVRFPTVTWTSERTPCPHTGGSAWFPVCSTTRPLSSSPMPRTLPPEHFWSRSPSTSPRASSPLCLRLLGRFWKALVSVCCCWDVRGYRCFGCCRMLLPSAW